MFKKEWDLLIDKMDKGIAKPCFAIDVLNGAAKKEFEIDNIEKIYTWTSLVEAGSDTSRIAILQTIAGAACYPEWTKKARGFLDEVCGANAERLPSLADRPKLPYITAVMKETLRWRPFLQSGVPHTLTKDDEYEGYRFPAGTEFSWNAYSIALVFNPDRFMNENLDKWAQGHWSFGAGMHAWSYNPFFGLDTNEYRSSHLRGVECRRKQYLDCSSLPALLLRF
jgi:cytochrome P450